MLSCVSHFHIGSARAPELWSLEYGSCFTWRFHEATLSKLWLQPILDGLGFARGHSFWRWAPKRRRGILRSVDKCVPTQPNFWHITSQATQRYDRGGNWSWQSFANDSLQPSSWRGQRRSSERSATLQTFDSTITNKRAVAGRSRRRCPEVSLEVDTQSYQ